MQINQDKSTYNPPFSVVELDTTDAFYYADVMDHMEKVEELNDYGKAVALADALFVIKNLNWESLKAMNDVDGGYDVRVYDSSYSCVYAAHTKYMTRWIGEHSAGVIFTPAIQKAVRFATKTHEVYQKQKRKVSELPFITHPLIVGMILARVGASEDVIVAGILHDTIEDSIPEKKVTKEMIAERFGTSVADLVESVTEKRKDISWKERKQEALRDIESFSNDSVLIKSSDVISNLSELLEDHARESEAIWASFNAPRESILENAQNVIAALQRRWLVNPLSEDLGSMANRLSTLEKEK